jgi:hypothetical protein
MNQTDHPLIDQALTALRNLGMPKGQQNKRSALTLLALLNLTPDLDWSQTQNPLIGITPVMDWIRGNYNIEYAPNSRETFRRFTMHQFVSSGIALYNPDDPERPVNSPNAVYQIAPKMLTLLRSFASEDWEQNLSEYAKIQEPLAQRYALDRKQKQIPVQLRNGERIELSPGKHSELIRSIIEDFGSRFSPDGILIYAGDTGEKWGYFDETLLTELGIFLDSHGKMPDVIIYDATHNWLFLIEAATSHGPVDHKRKLELSQLFDQIGLGLVFVSAFPDKSIMTRFLGDIAWETEVWIASDPSHLIHFNGHRFVGPMSY